MELFEIVAQYGKGLTFYIKEIDEVVKLALVDFEKDSFCAVSLDGSEYYHSNDYDLIPLLYPLSCITKKINVYKGGYDTPLDFLIETYYTLPIESQFKQILKDNVDWVNHLDYFLIEHLFNWNFDIHNLIKQNKAKDIRKFYKNK